MLWHLKIAAARSTLINVRTRPHSSVTVEITLYWAIPLFNYTPLQLTINGVQGGLGNMSRGVVI